MTNKTSTMARIPHSLKIQITGALLIAVGVGYGTRPLMGVASLAYLLIILGLIHRKKRAQHKNLMLIAIILDLSLVIGLEVQRSAIKTAASFSLSLYQQLHIGTSLVATLLYFPLLYLGFRLLKTSDASKKQALRRWHIPLGIAAFIFRSLGFILMFSLLTRQNY